MLICFCKIPLVTEKGHTLFRSYFGFFFLGKLPMLVSLPGRKKGRGSLVARKAVEKASIPYLSYIPMSSGSGCASFSSSHVLCLWQWWWSRMNYTKWSSQILQGKRRALEIRRHQLLGHEVSLAPGKVLTQR